MLYIDENYPLNDSDEDWIRQYQKQINEYH